MYTSVETKGIQGNDKRNYVLDLLRTMPPDVNFLGDALTKEDISLFPENLKELHLPRTHTHKLAAHRHELVEAFCENRYLQYWKLAMKNFAEAKKELDAMQELGEEEKKVKLMVCQSIQGLEKLDVGRLLGRPLSLSTSARSLFTFKNNLGWMFEI